MEGRAKWSRIRDQDFHLLSFMSNSQNYRCWGTSQRTGHSGLRYPLGFQEKTDKNMALEEVDVEIAVERVPPRPGITRHYVRKCRWRVPPLKGY